MSNNVPLKSLMVTFVWLFMLGIVLTLPLYTFNYKKFIRTDLFIKILFWIPIFAMFLFVLYVNNTVRLVLLVILLTSALIEFVRVARYKTNKPILIAYFVFFTLSLGHFYLIGRRYPAAFVGLLIMLCFVTVLSDVTAFFFGNYLGKHKLPRLFNNKKSWEGVFGQVVGGFLGILAVTTFIVHVPTLWLFLPLGIGCVVGDLANSFAKRQADIKDWSNAIPGHGGFIDRLSSIAGSCVALYYFLLLTKVLA